MFDITAWPQYSLNRRMGSPQSQSGHFGEEINLLPLPRFEPRLSQPEQSLQWLCYPISKVILYLPKFILKLARFLCHFMYTCLIYWNLNIKVKILEYQCCNKFQTHQWGNRTLSTTFSSQEEGLSLRSSSCRKQPLFQLYHLIHSTF